MPAYVINDMVVTDPDLFERYKQLSTSRLIAVEGLAPA